jgi:hypothetical protein
MKLLLICKDYPPASSVAGKATAVLEKALSTRGIDVETLDNLDCWYANVWQKNRIIRNCEADVIHIHYTVLGSKSGFSYQLLSLLNRKKVVVTLYDVGQYSLKERLMLLPFVFCKKVVFIDSFDRLSFLKIYFWKKKTNIHTIPADSTDGVAIAGRYLETYGSLSQDIFNKSLCYKWFSV